MKISGVASNIVSGIVGGFIVLGGNLIAQAQSTPQMTPIVRAQAFELCDNSGRPIGFWRVLKGDTVLALIGADGNVALSNGVRGRHIMLSGGKDNFVSLSAEKDHSGITASDGPNSASLLVSAEHALVFARGDQSSLSLDSADGKNRCTIGNTTLDTATGDKILRPLSSMTLFDEVGNVVWKAP